MKIHTDPLILSSFASAATQPVPRVVNSLHTVMTTLKRAASGFLLVLVAGCGQQEEGERCDPRNGSIDCADGLACIPLERLGQGREGAVCCPSSNPSDLICTRATLDLGGDDDDDDNGNDDQSTSPTTHDAASSTSHDASPPLLDAASASDASNMTGDAASSDAAPEVVDAAPDIASDASADATSDAAPDAAD